MPRCGQSIAVQRSGAANRPLRPPFAGTRRDLWLPIRCDFGLETGRYLAKIGFTALVGRGLNLFALIRALSDEYVRGYETPKTIRSKMNNNEPLTDYTIYYKPMTGAFGLITPDEMFD